MKTEGGEVLEVLDISEMATAYANAVPPRIVAKKIRVDECDVDAIAEERERFRNYVVNEYVNDDMFFTSQRDAWDAYSWSLEAWVGISDAEALETWDAPIASWEDDLYQALLSLIRWDNVDPETGGQL